MAMIPLMMMILLLLFKFPSVVLATLKSDEANLELVFTYHKCNEELGNFTTETYSNNRNVLLSNMYSDKEIENGFYNSSYGEGPDKVYGIGFCRGDVKPDKCRSCLEKSSTLLTDRCPVQKEAIGWYDLCMLRYSNRSIVEQPVTDTDDIIKCSNTNATNKDRFDKELDDLVVRMRSRSAEGDSRLKFAEGEAPVQSSNETIHALLQCVPYLSHQNCTRCLEYAMTNISSYCDGKTGGRYLGPSCSVRYEIYPFFEPIVHHAPPPQPATQVTTTTGKGLFHSIILLVVLSLRTLF